MKTKFEPRPRKIPFDLSKCLLAYKDVPELIKDIARLPDGLPGALNLLGMSLALEYSESKLGWIHKTFNPFGSNLEARNFIQQECQHGAYHHLLNRFIEPRYVNMKHSQIRTNFLVYPHYTDDELSYRKMLFPEFEEEKAQAIKSTLFQLSAFETALGIYNALGIFQVVEEHLKDILDICPFFTYLWLYHSTEEIEHVHVALSSYEERYQTLLFSKENIGTLNQEVDRFTGIYTSITLQLSNIFGFQTAWDDFEKLSRLPLRQKINSIRSKYRVGFNLEDISDLREHYINLFDKYWGPALERAIYDKTPTLKSVA